jgi:hypothetical protein
MLLKVSVIIVFLLAVTFAGIMLHGTFHRKSGTQELRDRLDSSRVSVQPQIVHFDEINGLLRQFRDTSVKLSKTGNRWWLMSICGTTVRSTWVRQRISGSLLLRINR